MPDDLPPDSAVSTPAGACATNESNVAGLMDVNTELIRLRIAHG
jgi:hypothetical protein